MLRTGKTSSDHEPQPLAPADVPRRLTARDIALGIGRKATEEEIEDYLSRPYGKSVPLKEAIANLKAKLSKKHDKKG
ncbi:MAG: hypothetical protein JST90_14910 [Bacteroidetes bacterium]|nr:hypothetical protein [Bacteroidota bacterium]